MIQSSNHAADIWDPLPMHSGIDRQAQARVAWQEHTGFRQQCVGFRKESRQLREAISNYREQLTALRQQAAQEHVVPSEIHRNIEFVQQQLRDIELTLYEIRFEFADLIAKFHLVQEEKLQFDKDD